MSKRQIPDWGDMSAAPRLDVADPSRLVWRRRWMTGLVGAVVVTFPVVGFAYASAVVSANSAPVAVPQVGEFSLSRLAAIETMTAWLGEDPAPLPGGRIVTVDSITPVVLPVEKGDEVGYGLEVVAFTLVDGHGQHYRSSLEVAVDPRGSATTISTPSLEAVPLSATDSWQGGSPWPGLATNSPSPDAQQAIQSWAEAYTSGDAAKLRQQLGDTDGTHWYTPLAGVAKVTASSDIATPLDEDGTVLAARVELTITWVGQKPLSDYESGPTITMDVRIEQADTAAPVVTAWGPAGTGPILLHFGNTIDGTGRAVPTVTAAPTPTASGTPSVSTEPTSSGTPKASPTATPTPTER